MSALDFMALSDTELADWHRAINPLWLEIQSELAKRRRALREAEDRAASGWPEYCNAEQQDQRDHDVGGASSDAFK
jgi:hypothetical protein